MISERWKYMEQSRHHLKGEESSWGALHSFKQRSGVWPLEFSQELEQPHFRVCVCREGTNLSSALIKFYQMFCGGFDRSITPIAHAQLWPVAWSNTNWASDLCRQLEEKTRHISGIDSDKTQHKGSVKSRPHFERGGAFIFTSKYCIFPATVIFFLLSFN